MTTIDPNLPCSVALLSPNASIYDHQYSTVNQCIDIDAFIPTQQTLRSPVDTASIVSSINEFDFPPAVIEYERRCEQSRSSSISRVSNPVPILPRPEQKDGDCGRDDFKTPGAHIESSNSIIADMRLLAKLRRQAQNRAAQRAYRLRKLSQVEELEARVKVLETNLDSLREENKRLMQELEHARVENETLKLFNNASRYDRQRHESVLRGPEDSCFPTDESLRSGLDPGPRPNRREATSETAHDEHTTTGPTGMDKFLNETTIEALWAFIQAHLQRQQCDLIEVMCKRLKDMASREGLVTLDIEHQVKGLIKDRTLDSRINLE